MFYPGGKQRSSVTNKLGRFCRFKSVNLFADKGHQYMRTIATMEDEEHIDVYAKVNIRSLSKLVNSC